MKNLTKLITLTTSLLVSSAYADNDTDDMYFGVGVYQSKLNSTTSVSGTSYTMEYKENNYKALIGKRLNDNMAVELQYSDFSKDSVAVNGAATVVDISGNSFGVAGLYHFNPQTNYSPFVKLGWYSWDLKATNTTTGVSTNDNGDNEFYGVGVDGKINETMKYRVEFERMKGDSDDDVDNIGIGLLFDF